MGDFSFPNVNWEYHTDNKGGPGKHINNNFFIQVLQELMRKGLLDLLLVNREGFMSEVEIGDDLGHGDHKVVKFKLSGDRRKTGSKTMSLDVERVDLRLLRELVSKVFWETCEGTGAHQLWSNCESFSKSHPLRAQEQVTPKCWKSSK